jgi:sterol desaturase/sphingolipid hydroxylase (fatty acid hydroxylase superfamily)
MAHVLQVLFALVVVGIPLLLLERRWPAVRGQRFFRRGRGTDVAFALLNAVVTEWVAKAALFVVALFVAGVLVVFSGAPRNPATLLEWLRMRSPVAYLSPLGQVAPALLVADLCGYWMHRSMHEGPLWRLHAVHHSARQLDWLAAARNHPLAEIVSRTGVVVPLVLMGFDLRVLAAVAPVLGVWAFFVHANVPWRMGWLRFVVATPAFHRWHHAADAEALARGGVNFAGLFPLWDLLFGTYFVPERQPDAFGPGDDAVPDRFFALLAHPLRRR